MWFLRYIWHVLHLFIYFENIHWDEYWKCMLRTYHMPGTALDSQDAMMRKLDVLPTWLEWRDYRGSQMLSDTNYKLWKVLWKEQKALPEIITGEVRLFPWLGCSPTLPCPLNPTPLFISLNPMARFREGFPEHCQPRVSLRTLSWASPSKRDSSSQQACTLTHELQRWRGCGLQVLQ